MAGIDKTYCNTVAEYEEFKQWAIENKFKTPMGETIDFTCHMYNIDSSIEDLQEQVDNGYDITVINTSFHLDYYLIKYCPIKFIQDRMREVYRKETIESILNGTSTVDTFNRDSIAGTKVKCIQESEFGKKDFHYKRKGKRFMVDFWIEIDDSSTEYNLWYNENLNHWTIYGRELEYHDSNVCHKPIKSRKALIRQIRKWRLPKGCLVMWKGYYVGDEICFKVV